MKRILLAAFSLLALTGVAHAQFTVTDSIVSEGVWRYYRLYVPASYQQGATLPLVLNLHGYAASSTLQQAFTRDFMQIADTAGFFLVYPDGLKDSMGNQYWNAGLDIHADLHNDVLFLSSLIDTIHARWQTDNNQVYATGISNGGYMCYTLAWKLSNKITAIASVSGSMIPAEFAVCKPLHAIPVMEIHGTADNVVPYTSSPGTVDIDTLMHFWAVNAQCLPLTSPEPLPDLDPNDGSTVIHYVWSAEVRNNACELYKVVGGGHVDWPGEGAGNNNDFVASREIWRFLRNFRLSEFSTVRASAGQQPRITFFPNPCSNVVSMINPSAAAVTVSDMLGRLILTTHERSINVSALPAGVYFLTYQSGGLLESQKLVKR